MVTTRREVNSDEVLQMFVYLSENCFLCGKPFTENEDVVYWRGNDEKTTSVTLHLKCAAELAAHLLSDAARGVVCVFNRKLEKVGLLPKLSLPAKVKTVRPQKEQSKGE
jgi:hypothetical protein